MSLVLASSSSVTILINQSINMEEINRATHQPILIPNEIKKKIIRNFILNHAYTKTNCRWNINKDDNHYDMITTIILFNPSYTSI
jgi:hypothetical protein